MTKRLILIATLLIASVFYFAPQPEANAFDPVIVSIVAPIALKAAQVVAPYAIKAFSNMLKVMIRMGGNVLGTLRLPLGLIQCTVLAPWCFKSGLKNLLKGAYAPIQLIGNALLLPLSPFGIGVKSGL